MSWEVLAFKPARSYSTIVRCFVVEWRPIKAVLLEILQRMRSNFLIRFADAIKDFSLESLYVYFEDFINI